MENFLCCTTTQGNTKGKGINDGSGLQNLVFYYQTLFDIDENINHYNSHDYRKARRKFVQYLMNSRIM